MSHAIANPSPPLSTTAPCGTGIVVGIDPGLDKHGVVALLAGSCHRLERRMIDNTIAGMEMLVELLKEWRQQSGGHLAVAIEEATAYGEALECFLSGAGFQPVVVCALKVARFKEVIGVDANDLVDAEAVARFVRVCSNITGFMGTRSSHCVATALFVFARGLVRRAACPRQSVG